MSEAPNCLRIMHLVWNSFASHDESRAWFYLLFSFRLLGLMQDFQVSIGFLFFFLIWRCGCMVTFINYKIWCFNACWMFSQRIWSVFVSIEWYFTEKIARRICMRFLLPWSSFILMRSYEMAQCIFEAGQHNGPKRWRVCWQNQFWLPPQNRQISISCACIRAQTHTLARTHTSTS